VSGCTPSHCRRRPPAESLTLHFNRPTEQPPQDKTKLYLNRFNLLLQRLRRNRRFQPPNPLQAAAGAAPQAQLTELMGLKGNAGETCIVMGIIGSQVGGRRLWGRTAGGLMGRQRRCLLGDRTAAVAQSSGVQTPGQFLKRQPPPPKKSQEDGHLAIEDVGAKVPLDLSEAKLASGFLTGEGGRLCCAPFGRGRTV
jgi:hypothetical protein